MCRCLWKPVWLLSFCVPVSSLYISFSMPDLEWSHLSELSSPAAAAARHSGVSGPRSGLHCFSKTLSGAWFHPSVEAASLYILCPGLVGGHLCTPRPTPPRLLCSTTACMAPTNYRELVRTCPGRKLADVFRSERPRRWVEPEDGSLPWLHFLHGIIFLECCLRLFTSLMPLKFWLFAVAFIALLWFVILLRPFTDTNIWGQKPALCW